jgi:hypothetical protein
LIGAGAIVLANDVTVAGVADDLLLIPIGIGLGVVITTEFVRRNRTHITYTMTNGDQVYAGRASGFGPARMILARRMLGHALTRPGFGGGTIDRAAIGPGGYRAIRGREQQLIDHHGGVGHPNVSNRIRGVARNNPMGRRYHEASNRNFGCLHIYTGN